MAVSVIAGLSAAIGAAGAAGALTGFGAFFGFLATTAGMTAFALGAGLSVISRALAPKPSLGNQMRGITQTTREPAGSRKLVYGQMRVGGQVVFLSHSGDDNKYLHLAIAFASHEIESYEEIWFNDKQVWTSSGGFQSDWGTYVTIDRKFGTASQAASTQLVNANVLWTTNHKLSGIAYIAFKLEWNQDKFPQGVPNITAVIKGKKVYDPRDTNQSASDSTTWTYSTNPALCLRDYLVDEKYGLGEDRTLIDETVLDATADLCDETQEGGVDIYSVSGQKRYTLNGVIDTRNSVKDNIEQLLSAMGGRLTFSGGKYFIEGAEYKTPTVTLDESVVISEIQTQTKQSRRGIYNGVKGIFVSEEKNYKVLDYPAQISSTYATEDGDPIYLDMPLPFVTNNLQAQLLAKIALLKSRQQTTIAMTVNLTGLKLKVGDTVMVTNSRLGYSSKVFEVIDYTLANSPGGELGVQLQLIETASAVYDWTSSDEEDFLKGGELDLYDGRTVDNVTSLTGTEIGLRGPDGGVSSSIELSWTAPDDAFVEFYSVRYNKNGTTEYFEVETKETNILLSGLDITSNYDFRVQAQNLLGVRSTGTSITNRALNGDTTAPSAPTGVTLTAGINQITCEWTNPTDIDLAFVEVHVTTTSATPSVSATPTAKSPGEEYIATGLSEATRYFHLRAVDYSGNKSAYTTQVSATSLLATSSDIADGAVDTDQIATDAITEVKIEDGAVTADKITVNELSAISADVGAITAGTLQAGGSNAIPDANDSPSGSETGAFIDLDNGKFVFGDANKHLLYDGSTLLVKGELEADILDVIDATITGQLTANAISAGAVTVASLSAGVFAEFDDRYGTSGGFYVTDTDEFFDGNSTKYVTVGTVAHSTDDIYFECRLNHSWSYNRNDTGDKLKANVSFEYSTDNSTWTTVPSSTTQVATATGVVAQYATLYSIAEDITYTMTGSALTAGNYYFRVKIVAQNTTNAFQLAALGSGSGVPIAFEVQESSGISAAGGNADTLDGLDSTQFLRSDTDDTFSGNLTITGDLILQGGIDQYNVTNLTVDDKTITVNAGSTQALSDGAGLIIDRGTAADASITWDETNDEFDLSHGASINGHLLVSSLGAFGNSTLDPDAYGSYAGGFGNIADGSGWVARGLFIHGGGTGDAAAIGHNGSNLYFGIQNGSSANSMDSWLTVTPAKVANFAAQVNVSGHGNSSQWNTAYGWGDHSTQGYLTAEADTLATVTGRGATTTNAISTGNITSSGTVTAQTAGSSLKGPVYIAQQNTTGEGGEISLNGSNGHTSHTIDTVNGTFRIFDVNGTFISGNSGYGLNAINGYRVNGTQVINASRNVVNVGTISASGAITSTSGASSFLQAVVTSGGLRVAGGGTYSDHGSQMYLHADSSGYGRLAVYHLRIMTGANNSRVESVAVDNNGNVNIARGALQINGTTRINNAGNATLGTTTTGALTATNITATSLSLSGTFSITSLAATSTVSGSQFRASYGSVSAPAFTFKNDDDTGMWSAGGDVKFAVGGSNRMTIGASATTVSGRISVVGDLQAGSVPQTIITTGRAIQNVTTVTTSSTIYSGGTLTVNGNNLIVSGGGQGDGKLYFSGYGSASQYNYFLKADNDTGRKAVMFVNGSTRSADGGPNTFTIRNDSGSLRLGNSGYSTLLEGSLISFNGTTILSSSRNLVNIGTISSGSVSITGTLAVSSTSTLASVNGTYFSDGYVTWNAAQFNRSGAYIELQWSPVNSSAGVRIGGNTSNPIVFDAYNGTVDASGYKIDGTTIIDSDGNVLKNTVIKNPTDEDAQSGTWSESNTSGSWGSKYGNGYAYTDTVNGYKQFNIPSGMNTCYMSQLQWSTGGYVDIHGVQSDGDLVFLKRVATYQHVEHANHGDTAEHDGNGFTLIGSNLTRFASIRLTNKEGRFHFTGLKFTKESNAIGDMGVGTIHGNQIGMGVPRISGLSHGTTTIIDASRNLVNLASLTTSSNIIANGGYIQAGAGDVIVGTYSTTATGSLYLTGSTANKQARLFCSNGNLHMDANSGNGMYLNYYNGNAIYFGSGASGSNASITAAGNFTTTGSVALNSDAAQLQLGSGNRAQIFHNSAGLYLRTSTGGVYAQADSFVHYSANAASTYFSSAAGGLSFNNTQFLTSARNLVNIGTISSGQITSSGSVTAGNGSTSLGFYVGTTQVIQGSTRNLVNIGTINSAGITAVGNNIFGSTAVNYDQYIRGNSNVGLRIQTNAQGTTSSDGMRIGLNGVHAFVWQFEALPLAFATSNAERLSISATGGFDFKGNPLSNITTISSGAITSSGQLSLSGNNLAVFGPNTGWSASLAIGGNANNSTSTRASIGTTNGNLHIDAANGNFGTYLNFYDGTQGVYIGNGASGIASHFNTSGHLNLAGTGVSASGYALSVGSTGVLTTGRALHNITFVQSTGDVTVGESSGTAYGTLSAGNLFFSDDSLGDKLAYSIGLKRLENIGGNYTKLNIDWHTGITLGAATGYGGIRFFANSVGYYNSTVKLFSVGETDNHTRFYYELKQGNTTVIDSARNLTNINNAYVNALYGLNDTNTYINFAGNDQTRFYQGGQERVQLNTSGLQLHTGTRIYRNNRTLYNSSSTAANTVQYVKLYDRGSSTGGSTDLRFRLLAFNHSEYSLDVKIHIPTYGGFYSSYGTSDSGQGIEVEITCGGLSSQGNVFKEIIEVANMSSSSDNTEIWLKIQPPHATTRIDIAEQADSTDTLIPSGDGTGWTTTAPSNQQRVFPIKIGKTINHLHVDRGTTTDIGGALQVDGTEIVSSTRRFYASTGTSVKAAYSFEGDSTTGMYRPATSEVAFIGGGSEKLRIKSTGELNIASGGSLALDSGVMINSSRHLQTLVRFTTNDWFRSSDSVPRFYFENNGATYIRAASDWYLQNNSGANVFKFTSTGVVEHNGTQILDASRSLTNIASLSISHASNVVSSITNADASGSAYSHRANRLLTSNGSNWAADGRDPMMAFSSGNSATTIGNSIGITMHNESQTDNTFSPMIAFSNRSNSGSYNTTYASIVGRKTGQGADSNWSAGELWFYAMPESTYASNHPTMYLDQDGLSIHGSSSRNADTRLFIHGHGEYDPCIFLFNNLTAPSEGLEIWYDNSAGDSYITNKFSTGSLKLGTGTGSALKSASNTRFEITGDGHVVLGGNMFSPYISRTEVNTLNAGWGNASDAADMWINYRGYQNGTSYFRDFRIGDGKNVALVFVDGSARTVDFQNNTAIQVGGQTIIDSGRVLQNISNTFITGNLYINNASPTVYLRDSDHRSCMLHCNSNYFYVLRGSGTNSTGWSQYNGYWPVYWNLENNNAVFGGTITAASNITAYSDIRKKKDIRKLDNATDYLRALEAKRYKWKVDDREDIGFIAQDVEAAGLDVFVTESERADPSTGKQLETVKALDYGRMVSVLWQAVKEQQDQIDSLKQIIEEMKNGDN